MKLSQRPGFDRAAFAALFALAFAVYWQVHDHEFVAIDDPIYIVENPNLTTGLGVESVARAFTEPYETNWIPLTWISLQIDHALFGLDPTGYHLENVALHALSAVLLYLVLTRMTGSRSRSLWVAAVFAVHPLHVESVAWATERKDTLSGVFWMLTLLSYASYCNPSGTWKKSVDASAPRRWKEPGSANEPGSIRRYLMVLTFFSLGLLAKPMAVVLPVVLLLLDYWPLSRLTPKGVLDPTRVKHAVVEKLPLLAIAAAVGVVTVVVQSEAGAVLQDDLLSFRLRTMNAMNSYVAYIADSFWPADLSLFYPHPMGRASGWLALAQASALLAATVGFAVLARTRPYWIVGWLWFMIALLPVIGFVQVGLFARADRYLYLPQTGLAIALAWGVHDLFGRRSAGRRALAWLGIGSVAALAVVASQQTSHWRNTQSLYERAVAATDPNSIAHLGLAGILLRSNRIADAETHYLRALEINPGMAGAHAGLADVHATQGRLDMAIEGYRRALGRFPERARWRAHLGKALAENGQPEAAIPELQSAIRLYGENVTPEAHAYLAGALSQVGQLGSAKRQYLKAIARSPEYGDAHANLGVVLVRQQHHLEAHTHLVRALELDVDTADLHANLAETSVALGNPAEAVRHYDDALRLRSGWVKPANNLAWILATHPDPQIRDADRAIRVATNLPQTNPAYLDTLAAAQAAAGLYDDAAKSAAAALALAREDRSNAFISDIEARLALYRAGRPFIDSAAAAD